MNQVHGNCIVVVNDIWQECEEADGMVTKLSDVPLAVRVADCGNISCYDPVARVIGICHAGRRGTVAGIVSHLIASMKLLWSDAQNIYVYAWPSICQSCHQFVKQTEDLFDDQYCLDGLLDLRAVWRDQLLQAGCVPEHIVISPECTMCQSEFPSFKRNGTNERMIHIISMRE